VTQAAFPPRVRANVSPYPILKWAGGKGQLLAPLMEAILRAGPIQRYHEPFLGGGALFFALAGRGLLGRRRAFLSDANGRLIEMYQAVADSAGEIIRLLHEHANKHCAEHYYAVRAAIPACPPARAARLIYLNRTCFNGLYRENARGLFNVPMGRYANPRICDESNLLAASAVLKRARLHHRDFEQASADVAPGDFVYFDPPYDPVSSTACFTGYHAELFTRADQERLARTFAELHERGAKLLLSNSDTPFIRSLYGGFTIETVYARRNVNSHPARRGPVAEVLVRNF
jgi:DNA adenine methylase